jgi:hypothetical protein
MQGTLVTLNNCSEQAAGYFSLLKFLYISAYRLNTEWMEFNVKAFEQLVKF